MKQPENIPFLLMVVTGLLLVIAILILCPDLNPGNNYSELNTLNKKNYISELKN